MAIAQRLRIAAQVIKEFGVPIDRLPYTPTFAAVSERFRSLSESVELTDQEVWQNLLGARKCGLVGASKRQRRTK